ncbi:MAG TPA: sortase [Jiangellaceae bacterium]
MLAGCAGETQPVAELSAPSPATTNPQSPGPVATIELELTGPEVPRSPATVAPAEPPDAPVSIELSAVNVSAEVVPVGIADDGQMELPPHPDVIGWYRFGPTTGSGAGSIVMAGHVDSRTYGLGQFVRLHESQVGDEVLVRTESGLGLRYTVVDVLSMPKAELPLADVFSREGDERLLLITCGGEFDRQQGYADNIIVTAVPA